jgi:hypothetical protein
MKKIFLLLIGMLSQMAALQAFDIEARVAYFYPTDNRLREIYGKNGWADYQVEVAAPLNMCCNCSWDWDLWFNAAYYQKSGHSTCLRNHTRVENWAFNFGVKRYFDMCTCFRPYLGLGGGFAHVQFRDKFRLDNFGGIFIGDTHPIKSRIHRWGGCLLVKSGVRYDFTCNIFADIFLDYSFNWFNREKKRHCVRTRSIDTGGLKTGLGLGYQF